jgi:hypothetical protein
MERECALVPHAYLTCLFNELPKATCAERSEALLVKHLKPRVFVQIRGCDEFQSLQLIFLSSLAEHSNR